jgi:hypothetical protein
MCSRQEASDIPCRTRDMRDFSNTTDSFDRLLATGKAGVPAGSSAWARSGLVGGRNRFHAWRPNNGARWDHSCRESMALAEIKGSARGLIRLNFTGRGIGISVGGKGLSVVTGSGRQAASFGQRSWDRPVPTGLGLASHSVAVPVQRAAVAGLAAMHCRPSRRCPPDCTARALSRQPSDYR